MIRVAVAEDASALVEIRALMFAEMGVPSDLLGDPTWRTAARDWFATVSPTDRHAVVVEVDGVVVSGGVAEVTDLIPGPSNPNGRVGLISNIATDPAHRGQGWGRAVTQALVDWLVEQTDVTRIDLFATEAGGRIYSAMGFEGGFNPAMRLSVHR